MGDLNFFKRITLKLMKGVRGLRDLKRRITIRTVAGALEVDMVAVAAVLVPLETLVDFLVWEMQTLDRGSTTEMIHFHVLCLSAM